MNYSVFDWTTRQYRVYRDQRPAPIMADAPRCAPGERAVLGMVDVNSAICVVPSDAQFVAWRSSAVGRVSRLASGMAGVPARTDRRTGSPNLG
jgi:hypothetical protein